MNQLEIIRNWFDVDADQVVFADTSSKNVMRVETGEGTFYLKQKSSVDEVDREMILHERLGTCQVPTAVPLKGKNQKSFYEDGGRIYCLYPALPGNPVEKVQSTQQAYAFGEAIARLHRGLKLCSESEFPVTRMDLKSQLRDWAIPVTQELDPRTADVSHYLDAHLIPVLDALPQQIIHRDSHPMNMLFEDGELTGFIDFDISTHGIRIFDPCYCSTAMLMQDFKEQAWREQWFGLFSALIQGYRSGTELTEQEQYALFPVLLAIEFIFTAYFKEINEPVARLNLDALMWLFDQRDRF